MFIKKRYNSSIYSIDSNLSYAIMPSMKAIPPPPKRGPKPKYPWGTTAVGKCFTSQHDLYTLAHRQNVFAGFKKWTVYQRGDTFECWRVK